MDNRGYIFSTDAVLALVIFFVIAGSILTYYTLPSYIGADHQHLEAEADSALALLTNDADLKFAIMTFNAPNATQEQKNNASALLKDKLSLILPSGVNYDLKIDVPNAPPIKSDDSGIGPSDVVSRYTVISAPQEGWVGRAWYKIEDVTFKQEPIDTTQTLWNFHNYLCNFPNWQYKQRLGDSPYWGINGGNPENIQFSIPSDAVLKSAYFLIGCTGMKDNVIKVTKSGYNSGAYKQLNFAGVSDTSTSYYSGYYYPLDGVWNTDKDKLWCKGNLRIMASEGGYYPQPTAASGTYVTLDKKAPTFGNKVTFNNKSSSGIILTDSMHDNSPFDYILSLNNEHFFNAKSNIPKTLLKNGVNDFYVQYFNATFCHQMPWFSILADYKTYITIPEGIYYDFFKSKDCAGACLPQNSKIKNPYYVTYNLSSGESSGPIYGTRQIDYNEYKGNDSIYADGVPFVLKSTIYRKGAWWDGSAIATVHDIDLTKNNEKIKTDGVRVLDGYTVVNTYGATDKVLVEVYDGESWNTAFSSQDSSKLTGDSKGYGNTPGIVYIKDYLKPGVVNKVRVTVWDDSNPAGTDYDVVGLVDTYSVVSFTSLPTIKWDNFPFESMQYATGNTKVNGVTKPYIDRYNDPATVFEIRNDTSEAEKVMFFFGVGSDTTHVKLEVSTDPNMKQNTEVLYDGSDIPFSLDIGDIDVKNKQIFTKPSHEEGVNYVAKGGKFYARLTVRADAAWKSGDEGDKSKSASPEIFSGSRISVIYPKFLRNEWETVYADTANKAKQNAVATIIEKMNLTEDDYGKIRSEALYTGDMPSTVPIRLDLWRS